jgi:hypothetical protein
MTLVEVALGSPIADYFDYPKLPQRLHRRWTMEVMNDRANDPDWVVSESIRECGIWEPMQTMVLASAFAAAEKGTLFLDLGCHVGWFSMLAVSFGISVHAVEGNPASARIARRNLNNRGVVAEEMIGPDWRGIQLPRSIVKMDLEGAEEHAFRRLAPSFVRHHVTHCVMEVSPVFNNTYPFILNTIIGCGYHCHVITDKRQDFPPVDNVRDWLDENCISLHRKDPDERRSWINRQHQFDVVLHLPDARWG